MTIALLVIALLLWFIWRQMERIANELATLRHIAVDRHVSHHDTPQNV